MNLSKNEKYFYIILFEDYSFKFGVAKDYEERVKAYLDPWCKKVIKIYYVKHYRPRFLEKHFKDKFKYFITSNSVEYVEGKNVGYALDYLKKIYSWKDPKFKGIKITNYNQSFNLYEYDYKNKKSFVADDNYYSDYNEL